MKKEYTDTAIYVSTLEEYFKIKETHILSQKIISVCSECHTIFTRTLLSLKKKDKLLCSHCGHALGAKAMTPEKYKKRTCKTKQTLQKRYGVTNISQLDSVKKKKEETTIKNYGSKYFWTSETSKQLVEAKYGVKNVFNNPDMQLKIHNILRANGGSGAARKSTHSKMAKTCLDKYGVENIFSSELIKEKIRKTNIKQYGVYHPMKNEMVKQKAKQTKYQRYGSVKPHCVLYEYNNIFFDSKPELAFYVYYSDLGHTVEREPIILKYKYKNEEHDYIPDFRIDNVLYEIKGPHLINENGKWKSMFGDSIEDEKAEAKYECAKKNNVKIIYADTYNTFIQYVIERYGKDFFLKYKK